MVTDKQRKLIQLLVKVHVFRLYMDMRCVQVDAIWGFGWLLKKIKLAQAVDDYHHAPACPANHWHKQRLVFRRCNCGAELDAVIRHGQNVINSGLSFSPKGGAYQEVAIDTKIKPVNK